jgi:SAM-dependent methyltransferase
MRLSKWRLKQLWMYPFMRTDVGASLYEWLTAVVLGTQSGMSRKWCHWFREHVVLCRRFGGVRFPGKRIWLFQPGWSLAPVIMSKMVTGQGPLVTEDRRRLATRYLAIAILEVAKVGQRLCASAGMDHGGTDPTSADLLQQLRRTSSADAALRLCEAEYHVGDLCTLEGIPSRSVDICFSMGRLEHFSPRDLDFLLAQMHRVLVPGGVGSHIVDHRDHYWHYDKSIHCFHHLTFSDKEWEALCRGRKSYRNRLLEPDYLRAFRQADFEVLAAVHDLHQEDAAGVDPRELWGPYAGLEGDDLRAAVSHFIVRSK